MSNLEENIKRDELIDGFFNKGWNCDLDEVYKATMGTIHDLEQANDDKIEEIERLNNIIDELENYLNEQVDYMTHHSIERMVAFDCCRHKLQELKGSDKE